jgi:manganese/zinc/iron transport system substrate-binding protein
MRVSRRTVLAGLAAIAVFPPLSAAKAQDVLQVVATTGMIADAARNIGGNLLEVRALMGPGIDPHAYRQTRTDIVAMAQADLVLWHGLYLEAQMQEFLFTLEKEGRKIVAVAESLPHDKLIAHDIYKDKFDPHVWMNPTLWSQVVIAIRDALIAAAPQHEAPFRANADRHLAELVKLANYATEALATVPKTSRVLVTAHDAFNYFGTAYGFEVMGIQGISTESEAGLQRMAQLVDMLLARNIKAVFVETSVADRNIRALIEGAAAKGHAVKIGGELFSDAMGVAGTYEGTYIGMIDHNATIITRALGGTAPARGMANLLSG